MSVFKSFRSFPRNFYTVIVMEFFERGSYYGVMSVLSVYLALSVNEGGLGFSKESIGVIKSTITPLLYLLPILSGAMAARFGYKKILSLAFVLMSSGYALSSTVSSYPMIFLCLILMACGAGLFKPLIAGTIARSTDENNSSLGFGIYYWSINLGAFIFPLILIPWMKTFGWNYIFIMAAVGTGWLFILNMLSFRETTKPDKQKTLKETFVEMFLVLKNVRFILLIVIYSLFWIMYFQMYDAVLWYVTEQVDMSAVNAFVNSFLSNFTSSPNWKFDAEHVTVVNAGVIILLQLLVSAILKKTKPLPTMMVGILFGSLGMAILAFSTQGWIFLLGCVVFTLGEMTAHPKFISYVGLVAPEDKKALYQGYAFLYGVIGSGVGGILGAVLYVHFVEQNNNPSALWLTFSCIGLLSVILLFFYNRLFGRAEVSRGSAE
ncbi:MAG: peptide permease [Bacteroidetes bacterium GWF2_43_63]|nr:MAG: peptide permease [Bacteroidetes bacterium GWE2_42_42]OFY56207.1 MAG: peptide permease [Bacteroidetes bacterium GWF2_43_63]HBG70570.1 MFS transporter [Bacteroidales bacterium]HCB61993.1 MFS transporter [Bacteroidales bacterium]HCY22748.1 MFS transporter [Bacteroidales bacterium]